MTKRPSRASTRRLREAIPKADGKVLLGGFQFSYAALRRLSRQVMRLYNLRNEAPTAARKDELLQAAIRLGCNADEMTHWRDDPSYFWSKKR
ncbi:MAG TPA: hypothetical protein VKD24_02755 [Candidatus Angelobacter sp.]|nr:hypothetical protein [Candidatus Angelobacter sp.]